MHYIRFLRTPALVTNKGRSIVPVILTITTDLGDSFLNPQSPIKLKVGLYDSVCDASGRKVLPEEIQVFRVLEWTPGTRVLKADLELPRPAAPSAQLRLFAFPTAHVWGGSTWDVASSLLEQGQGRIMPVWADVHLPGTEPSHVSYRRLRIGKEDAPNYLEIEEEIGESIARHVWDAGVVVTSLVLQQSNVADNLSPSSKILSTLSTANSTSIIELGCGVGILGLGVATWLAARGSEHRVLLTDLPEAAGRAEANISRLLDSPSGGQLHAPVFESLDWEDGRNGVFGPHVRSQSWDLIVLSDCTYNVDVLPALVGTLGALHDCNKARQGSEETKTRVLLATKPRHSSEMALFRLMENQGWSIVERDSFPLPVIGESGQSVELYLFAK